MKVSREMPLKSNAGWYMGCVYVCNRDFPGSEQNHHNFKDGDIHGELIHGFPYSRETEYYATKEELIKAMEYEYGADYPMFKFECKFC